MAGTLRKSIANNLQELLSSFVLIFFVGGRQELDNTEGEPIKRNWIKDVCLWKILKAFLIGN